jgi:hypothetical protein
MEWVMSISITKVRHWLGRHLLFWLVVMGGLLYVSCAIHALSGSYDWREILTVTAIMLPYNMMLVYLGLYWALPPALTGGYGRWVVYLPGSWVLISLYRGYVLVPLLTGKLTLLPDFQETIAQLDWYIALAIVGVAVSIKLYRFWYQREQANQQLAHETGSIELQVLKAQVHPHFLFNTLNNLYALTLKHSPQAPDMVLKLSGLMKYMIHECQAHTVPLVKEIEFLSNYIELEKQRYGRRLGVSVGITGEMGTTRIAPLLLIPFVENAFKHGSSQQIGQARIGLSLGITSSELVFRIENSRDEKSVPGTLQNTDSIGLATVQKRLTLLYPDAHRLVIRPEIDRFIVELTIQLGHEAVLTKQ